MTKSYGPDSIAWDEAKRQCRALLLGWAREGRFGTYSEVAQAVSAIDWPEGAYTNHGQQIGYLLGQVSVEELDAVEDRPILSALVIGQEQGMPSQGFWSLLVELDVGSFDSDLARMEFWVKEFRRACGYFGRA